MSGIDLMNRDNVGGVIVKCGEPFLLFLVRPLLFRRCDVVISLGGALLEWTWSVHRGKRGGAQILRGLFYFRANLRRNSDQTTAHNVFAKLVQVFGNVWDQFVRGWMLALDLLENLKRRFVRVDLFRGLGECFLFGF